MSKLHVTHTKITYAPHMHGEKDDKIIYADSGDKYHRSTPIATVYYNAQRPQQADANATLYADAHNTYNKCGKLPSELMEEWMEMKEIITTMTRFASDDGWGKPLTHKNTVLRSANALLTKIESNQTPQP